MTTVIVDEDEEQARVQTLCAASGIEMACWLCTEYRLLSIQCYFIEEGRWKLRDVTEVWVGMLGDAAVAVFRDDQGNAFCPDAPGLRATHVAELVLVGGVVGRPQRAGPTVKTARGRLLHSAFVRAHGSEKGSAQSPEQDVEAPQASDTSRSPSS